MKKKNCKICIIFCCCNNFYLKFNNLEYLNKILKIAKIIAETSIKNLFVFLFNLKIQLFKLNNLFILFEIFFKFKLFKI